MADDLLTLIGTVEQKLRRSAVATLDKRTKDWAAPEREEARNLLIWWFQLADKGRTRAQIERTIIEYLVRQYEIWLRAVDAEVQKECARNPPSNLMKAHGDPCKPLFTHKSSVGYYEVHQLEMKLTIFSGGDVEPDYRVWKWYDAYRFKKDVLRQMYAQALAMAIAGFFTHMTSLGAFVGRRPLGVSRQVPAVGGGAKRAGPLGATVRQPRLPATTAGADKGAAEIASTIISAASEGGVTGQGPRAAAQRVVSQMGGRRIVVNIGGTGEVEGAINLNPNRVAPRKNIPNLVQAKAEQIGDLFTAGQVHEIVSNRLPPNTIDWERVIPGASRVLRSDGSITIRFQGVGQDADIVIPALKKAGFGEIEDVLNKGAVITAKKKR